MVHTGSAEARISQDMQIEPSADCLHKQSQSAYLSVAPTIYS